jgi:deoxyhypusine synthase
VENTTRKPASIFDILVWVLSSYAQVQCYDLLIKRLKRDSTDFPKLDQNNIPVYCPALTDGSLGDMLFCHAVRNPGLIIDIVQDIRLMNGEAIHATPRKTGIIVLGGGLPKHHICNANMFRNGADYAVYINTAQEFDGSDSGAQPDEAVSWGKIKGSAKPVKVHCDATIAFPLIVAATFARKFHGAKQAN